MTSSASSNTGLCPTCQQDLVLRPVRPYPVVLQMLFGVSFFGFLPVMMDAWRPPSVVLWAWSGVQLVLGVLLVRARTQASRRTFYCLHCSKPVP